MTSAIIYRYYPNVLLISSGFCHNTSSKSARLSDPIFHIRDLNEVESVSEDFLEGFLSGNASRPFHQIRWWTGRNTKSGLRWDEPQRQTSRFWYGTVKGVRPPPSKFEIAQYGTQRKKSALWNFTTCCFLPTHSNKNMWITDF